MTAPGSSLTFVNHELPPGEKARLGRVDGCARHFRLFHLALIIIGLLFVEYPELWLGTHSLFDRDYGAFTYPLAYYAKQSLWRGEVPLWNPLNHCGIPFLAQWNTTVCYPLSWLYFLLPMPWSLSYFCFGHLVLAGLGMYLLAYRWTGDRFSSTLAGLVYALNGLSLNALMWTSILAALAWLPFVVFYAEQAWRKGGRNIFPAALAGMMQMLSGAPEIILMTWLSLVGLWLIQASHGGATWRRLAVRLGLVMMLVGILAAVQLFPFLELLGQSNRNPTQGNAVWSMPIWGFANFLVPLFRCSRTILGAYIQPAQQWTSSYYVGIAVLALAAVAIFKVKEMQVKWLAGLALCGILLALGENTFLYPALTRVFPPIGLARYPVKFVVMTVFALPLLAAFGTAWIARSASAKDLVAVRVLGWASGTLITLVIGVVAVSRLFPYPEESWEATLTNGVGRSIFLLLICAGIALRNKLRDRSKQVGLGYVIILLFGLDLLTHTIRQNATVPSRVYSLPQGEIRSALRLGISRALVSPETQAFLSHASTSDPFDYYSGLRRALFMDCNLLDDLPVVGGFYPLNLRLESEVLALFNTTNFPSGLADFLGVSQISSPGRLWEWTPRKTFLPWVTAGQRPIFADEQAGLKGIGDSNFYPAAVVFLPLEARGAVTATNRGAAKIISSRFTAQRVELKVNAVQPSLVVIAQAYYPSWKGYLDGSSVRIWRANHAFQAIEVPAGYHALELKYEDTAFRTGLLVSTFGFLLLVVLWGYSYSRRSAVLE